MNYNLTRSSTKINSINHFNYNSELKTFVQSYLDNKPNLEVIKITDTNCIKDIKRVLEINTDLQESSYVKRQRTDGNRIVPRQRQSTITPMTTSSSRLLNALSGHRLSNLNHISSPSINASNRKTSYK